MARRYAPTHARLTPKGTVVVSVCADVYANGKFEMGSAPSIEMSAKGKILDSIRGGAVLCRAFCAVEVATRSNGTSC